MMGMTWISNFEAKLNIRFRDARKDFGSGSKWTSEISYFPLAKGALIPSLPVPCQESEEKQKHGKPLPSVSKSLGQGKFCVANKGLATCCKARTANASVVLAKLLSSPMLTLETSERIFLFPGNLEIAATNNSSVRESDGLYPA
jgi:hypothetical protein